MKTVDDIYSLTKQLMFEKANSTIYDEPLIGNLNVVLQECFEENNMARIFNGKKPLESVPYVTTRQDEIDYEDEYLSVIIPLGLATYFLIDDDLEKYNLYNVRYQNARIVNQKLLTQEEIDAVITDTTI